MVEKKERVITLAGVVFTIGCQSTINKPQTKKYTKKMIMSMLIYW